MAKPVIICADSTCDLSQELIERFDIRVIPLTILLGEESYFDDKNFSPDKIYEYYEKTGTLPKTSAPSVQQYIDFFAPAVEAGYEIVNVSISSELSATFASSENIFRLSVNFRASASVPLMSKVKIDPAPFGKY